MLLQRIESAGLAHYSYVIGAGNEAVVIDPRRDCTVYIDAAMRAGCAITHVLETHRNEDYAMGSVELAARTGAEVLHSAYDELDYGYGGRIAEGEPLRIGELQLEPIHTPGHTLGHMSFLLRDRSRTPWVLFTGDALFAGDVGRTDFYGRDKLDEMTGLLYDSIFGKLLPLGDGVVVAPAHGPGSACGTHIADRPWTTIGLERKLNPVLQHTEKADFVRYAGRVLRYPPYFRMMEQLNLEGPPEVCRLPSPRPLSVSSFAEHTRGAVVLDTRMELAFNSAHVPGALSIWAEGLPGWAGWFLPYDKPLLLVTDAPDIDSQVRALRRIGYDNVQGYLARGMRGWHAGGLRSTSIAMVTVQELCHRLDSEQDVWILDVRSEGEVLQTPIPGAQHVHLSEVPQRMDDVPKDRPVYVFCGTGMRATVASSLLKRAGWDNLTVVLGGISGWSSITCPLPYEMP
jgi:hydroxyacylglutathione hydrolase